MTAQASVRYETQHELAHEPVRGLPEQLPAGEDMLWQGAPSWQGLARSAYHAHQAALYFGIILALRLVSGLWAGEAAASLAVSLLVLSSLAAAAVAVLVGFAVLSARTTVYTITNRRLVMRIGIALPMTLNLPFKAIVSASARTYDDGTADVPLELAPQHRLAFLILWPHCRPWQMRRPQPMLRRIPDGARVASLLARALAAQASPEAGRSREFVPDCELQAGRTPPVHDTVAA